jgi:hypothetical protein
MEYCVGLPISCSSLGGIVVEGGLMDVDVVGGNCVEDEGVFHVAFVHVNVKACDPFDGGPEGKVPAEVELGTPDSQFVDCIADFTDG